MNLPRWSLIYSALTLVAMGEEVLIFEIVDQARDRYEVIQPEGHIAKGTTAQARLRHSWRYRELAATITTKRTLMGADLIEALSTRFKQDRYGSVGILNLPEGCDVAVLIELNRDGKTMQNGRLRESLPTNPSAHFHDLRSGSYCLVAMKNREFLGSKTVTITRPPFTYSWTDLPANALKSDELQTILATRELTNRVPGSS